MEECGVEEERKRRRRMRKRRMKARLRTAEDVRLATEDSRPSLRTSNRAFRRRRSLSSPPAFSFSIRILTESYILSKDKPYETQCRLFLDLTEEEKKLFNKRNATNVVQVLIRMGRWYEDGCVTWNKAPEGVTLKIDKTIRTEWTSGPMDLGRLVRGWPPARPLTVDVLWCTASLKHPYVLRAELVVLTRITGLRGYLDTRPRRPFPSHLWETSEGGVHILSQEVPLLCPLTLSRLRLPVVSAACTHLSCFDAEPYLMLNITKGRWTCPICGKLAYPNSLHLDGFLQTILSMSQSDTVIMKSDGTWSSTEAVSEANNQDQHNNNIPIVTL